jgi:hypothetical protein
MKPPRITVDHAQFAQHINEVKRESGRSSEEMLKYIMILMCTAGRSATPVGKKNRSIVTRGREEVEDAPDPQTDNTAKNVQFFQVWKGGLRTPQKIFLPTIPRKTTSKSRFAENEVARAKAMEARKAIIARFKKISYRGIANASWGWALQLVAGSRQTANAEQSTGGRGRRALASMVKSLSGNRPFIEITNQLEYITKIAPGIEQRMAASADARLEKWLERRWQSGIDRAERRTA